MGLLDDILNAPQKTEADFYTPNVYDKTPAILNCETCGCKFKGQGWMVKSKKSITCPSCFGTQKRNEEFNN